MINGDKWIWVSKLLTLRSSTTCSTLLVIPGFLKLTINNVSHNL